MNRFSLPALLLLIAAYAPPAQAQESDIARARIGFGHEIVSLDSGISFGAQLPVRGDEDVAVRAAEFLAPLDFCRDGGRVVSIAGADTPTEKDYEKTAFIAAMVAAPANVICERDRRRETHQISPVIEVQTEDGQWFILGNPSASILNHYLETNIRMSEARGMKLGDWREGNEPGGAVFMEDGKDTYGYGVRSGYLVTFLFGDDSDEQSLWMDIIKAMGYQPILADPPVDEEGRYPVILPLGKVDPLTFFSELRSQFAVVTNLRVARINYSLVQTDRAIQRMSGDSSRPEMSRTSMIEQAVRRTKK